MTRRGGSTCRRRDTREEQIIAALKQYESGEKIGGHLPQAGGQPGDVLHCGRSSMPGLGVQELRELRQLRDENGRLKRLVADLSLDRQILQEIVSKKL